MLYNRSLELTSSIQLKFSVLWPTEAAGIFFIWFYQPNRSFLVTCDVMNFPFFFDTGLPLTYAAFILAHSSPPPYFSYIITSITVRRKISEHSLKIPLGRASQVFVHLGDNLELVWRRDWMLISTSLIRNHTCTHTLFLCSIESLWLGLILP